MGAILFTFHMYSLGPFLRKKLKSSELFIIVPLSSLAPSWNAERNLLFSRHYSQTCSLGTKILEVVAVLLAGALTATHGYSRLSQGVQGPQVLRCLKLSRRPHPVLIFFSLPILSHSGIFLLSRWTLYKRINNFLFSFYLRSMNNKNYMLYTCLIWKKRTSRFGVSFSKKHWWFFSSYVICMLRMS